MKISLKYRDQISKYAFEGDAQEPSSHSTIMPHDSYAPDDDEIFVDLCADPSELRKSKHEFDQIPSSVFGQEFYVKTSVCKSIGKSMQFENLGRLYAIKSWFDNDFTEEFPFESGFFEHVGRGEFPKFQKRHDEIFGQK